MRLPIQVQGIIYRQKGSEYEFLLLKRTAERGGFWQPVTGGVEEGETINETIYREVNEETGLKKEQIINLHENIHTYEFQSTSNCETLKEHVFGLKIKQGESITIDEREHTEHQWVNLQKALELLKWENNKQSLKNIFISLKKRKTITSS